MMRLRNITITMLQGNKPSTLHKKVRKLKNNPKDFVKDSKAFLTAHKTWTKLGSFLLVLVMSLVVVVYYSLIASPRYISNVAFVVKSAQQKDMSLGGLAALTGNTSNDQDAYVLKRFIESSELASKLDQFEGLKAHYTDTQWDWFSRLNSDATEEEFLEYYLAHIHARFDDLTGIIELEVQGFTPEYALLIAQRVMKESEIFINDFGSQIAHEQLSFAEGEVERAHAALLTQQNKLVEFQERSSIFSPEQQSGALVQAVNALEANLIQLESELKTMLSYMQPSASEVVAKKNQIKALNQQLEEERLRLTSTQNDQSISKLNTAYQEVKLNTELSTQLYTNALAGLETVRAEAYQKLKHVLVIQPPRQAQEDAYPKRLYNIITWFLSLLLIYSLGKLIVAIIKEHLV